MLLTPEYQESEQAEKHITAILLKQWLYDSHLWTHITEGRARRKCKWCGAESTINQKVAVGELFCPKNPIVEQIFNNVAAAIRKTKA